MSDNLPLIYDLDLEDVQTALRGIGEPSYRANQLWEGLYRHFWQQPDQFTMFSKDLRGELSRLFRFSSLTPLTHQRSTDGETSKILFQLPDGLAIETVHMRYNQRQSLCISTQSGCAMGCVFCATGQMGFKRNLSSGEIVEQVVYFARLLERQAKRVTNIVIMGMGEPFHNYRATMAAINRLNHSEGMNLGERRFTVSTVGLVPAIRQFADEGRQINLAISLHAANDELRSRLLPINKKHSIARLLEACRYYIEKTNRRITFEWALIQGVNDRPEDAEKLASLLKGMLCHVNLIPLNPTQNYEGEASTQDKAKQFCEILGRENIACTTRLRRGIDIQAGCGQLATLQSL